MSKNWEAYTDPEGTYVGAGDLIIAEMYAPEFAGLVVAAPDLLYALQELLPYMDRVPKSVKDNSPFAHRMKVALDAIAKAKGAQNEK